MSIIIAYAIGYYREYKKDKEGFKDVFDFILVLVAIVTNIWFLYYVFVQ